MKVITYNALRTKNTLLFFFFLILKIITVSFLISINKAQSPSTFIGIAQYHGDSDSYIAPVENYISKGSYSYFSDTPYIYRTPYYGSFYYLFRYFFNPYYALQALIVFQLILEVISYYFLSKLVFKFLRSKLSKSFFILLISTSLYLSDYSFKILTESISYSCLLLSFYFFFNFFESKKYKHIIISGIFFAIVVLLKPYFGVYYLIFGVSLLVFFKSEPLSIVIKKTVINSVFLITPFAILVSPWVLRNYETFGKIKFFNDYGFDDLTYSYRNFLRFRGESFIYWDHGSAGCFFEKTDEPCNFTIQDYFISENSSYAETVALRNKYVNFRQKINTSKKEEIALINEFDSLTENYKHDKPENYYFYSHLRIIKSFLFNSGSYYLPLTYSKSNVLLKTIKLSQSAFYYLCLIFGFLGILFLAFKRPLNLYFLVTPIFLIIFFPVLYGATEWRYFFHFYVFGALGATHLLDLLIIKIKSINRKYNL